MLRQSGIFRANEEVVERVMDSNDLDASGASRFWRRPQGIRYHGVKINIVDTPATAILAGEVERALKMVDGVVLLVDAERRPVAQTRYVPMKALRPSFPPSPSLTKIDRPDARVQAVVNELYDLFIDLDATEDQLEFPIIYTECDRAASRKHRVEEPPKSASAFRKPS